MKQKNIGSALDSRLKEENIGDGVSAAGNKRVSEHRMVDLSRPEARRALSPTALRGFFKHRPRAEP